MDFYNQYNFEEFIKLYSPDDKIINKIYNENHVINHEIVFENGIQLKNISIYEIKSSLKKNARF